MKNIIIGAGLGGLITGILLKQSKLEDEVIIYDGNRIPGGFCTAFDKATTYNDEKIIYTVNIPLISSDFWENEPFALFLDYLGVKNIQWKQIDRLFKYYPLEDDPFLFTQSGALALLERCSSEEERQKLVKFFNLMKKLFNEIFHKAYMNPTPLQAIKMLFTIPTSVRYLMFDKPYIDVIDSIGIETPIIRDILRAAEAFMGLDVDKISGIGEMLMIQSFLERKPVQPTGGDNYQTLSNRLFERFTAIGGKTIFNTTVDKITFKNNKAKGVIVKGEEILADNVIISTAQDRIKDLVIDGENIPAIKSLIKKIDSLPPPNNDFYSYYLIDKKVVDKYPHLTDIAYHIYKLKHGKDRCNWKLAMSIPDELYNDKYYVLWITMAEQDPKETDRWKNLRESDYKKYTEEKEKVAAKYMELLQESEPIFRENPPLKHLMTFSPASYAPYGSTFPISGLAQTPDNFGIRRMTPKQLKNLFISGGASFSAGMWGAIAGAWQGFVAIYKNVYGISIGKHDVMYSPNLKNLPKREYNKK